MQRLFRLAVLLVVSCLVLSSASVTSPFTDFVGDGSVHQLTTNNQIYVRTFTIIGDPNNANPIRIGGSNVGVSTGARVAPGAGLTFQPLPLDVAQPVIANNYYTLSSVYYYAAVNDKFSVVVVQ